MKSTLARWIVPFLFLGLCMPSFAGGPLLLREPGVPYRWAGNPPTVAVFPDTGSLGPLSPELAASNLSEALAAWQEVATASILLSNQGPANSALGPEGMGDYAAANVLSFLGVDNSGVTPIIFDSEDSDNNGNGDIFDLLGLPSGVLGVAAPEFVEDGEIVEGFVLLNGASVDEDDVTGEFFRGVIVHELGHLLNLAHSVVNGSALFFGPGPFSPYHTPASMLPDGTTLPIGVDDVETMFPLIDVSPQQGTGRGMSTPNMDDRAILSTLYPSAAHPFQSFGVIAGTLLANDATTPVTGAQMIARNWAGDPVLDAVSAISGDFGPADEGFQGRYRLNYLTPGGQYSLEVRETVIVAGYSTPVIGFAAFNNPPFPGPEEFYSGPQEAGMSPPDDPEAAPFLIETAVGTANSADIVFNSIEPPANDRCEDAVPISLNDLPFVDFPDVREAGIEMGEPAAVCAQQPERGSIWYRFNNDSAEPVTLHLRTNQGITDYYAVIQVFEGSVCGELSPLESLCDDMGGLFQGGADLVFEAQPHTSYTFKVSSARPSDAIFNAENASDLEVLVEAVPVSVPVNDDCSDALVLSDADLPFDLRTILSLASVEAREPEDGCTSGGQDVLNSVWYRFQNTSLEPIEVAVTPVVEPGFGNTYINLVLEAFQGDCSAPHSLACGPITRFTGLAIFGATLTFPPQSETLIRLHELVTPADLRFSRVALRLESPPPPPNDLCGSATEIDLVDGTFVDAQDTRGASDGGQAPTPSCRFPDDPQSNRPDRSPKRDVWYSYSNQTGRRQRLTLSTQGSDYSAGIVIYQGACNGLAETSCSAQTPVTSSSNAGSDAVLSADPGVSYLIRIPDFESPGFESYNGIPLGEAHTTGGHLLFTATGEVLPDVEVAVVESPDIVNQGAPATFRVRLENKGVQPVSSVALSIGLPESGALVTGPDGIVCQVTQTEAVCQVGDLAAESGIDADFSLTVNRAGTLVTSFQAEWLGGGPTLSKTVTTQATVVPFTSVPSALALSDASLRALQGPLGPFDGAFVGIALANLGDEATEVQVSARDHDGTSLPGGTQLQLPPKGQLASLAEHLSPSMDSTIIARGRPGAVRSFFLAGTRDLTKLDGVGRQLEESTESYFLSTPSSQAFRTRIFLFNPDPLHPAEVRLRLHRDPDAALIGDSAVGLAANGAAFLDTLDLFGEETEDGFVHLTSDLPVRAFDLRASDESFVAAPARVEEGSSFLLAPHVFADGSGGNVDIRLLNLSDIVVHVEATLRRNDGMTDSSAEFDLPAGRAFTIDMKSLFDLQFEAGEPISGSLLLKLTDPRTLITIAQTRLPVIGSVAFRGGRGFQAEVPLVSATPFEGLVYDPDTIYSSAVLQVAQSADLNYFTGLAVWNPFNLSAPLVVRAFDSEGRETARVETVLAATQRVIDLLNGTSLFGSEFSQIGGHIEVESAGVPLVSYALWGSLDLSFMAAAEVQQLPTVQRTPE
ncbi:MAG TPA: hypothetical protein VLV83_10770 [Acidobacteriota bacterium]|nr:hypothetical protein [Acidobacteriota bacterium]